MSFWKYLLTNRLWILLAFIGLVGVFILVWAYQGGAGDDIKWTLVGVGVLSLVFVGGNYIVWRRSR